MCIQTGNCLSAILTFWTYPQEPEQDLFTSPDLLNLPTHESPASPEFSEIPTTFRNDAITGAILRETDPRLFHSLVARHASPTIIMLQREGTNALAPVYLDGVDKRRNPSDL